MLRRQFTVYWSPSAARDAMHLLEGMHVYNTSQQKLPELCWQRRRGGTTTSGTAQLARLMRLQAFCLHTMYQPGEELRDHIDRFMGPQQLIFERAVKLAMASSENGHIKIGRDRLHRRHANTLNRSFEGNQLLFPSKIA
eukprot:TRINITY_DN26556_c0_g1_i1.p1 TRINITY_DN26556_c0_g1~~TRINITY_DN26556_c0_g1_i1.p1  ORF type:complete len:139 (+),score=16.91 TRINITY_DN26556_c0_g1_i1:106-522(+)